MDVAAALAELEELSTQVVEAVVLGQDGTVAGATGCGPDRASALAARGAELLEAARDVRPGGPAVTRVDVTLESGSVFAVREHDRTIVATTGPEPTAGLVVYDLRTVLRRASEAES
jgi:predicted regulator of Ras-like GTPase activity (Roadblock/LC7/MglB family)